MEKKYSKVTSLLKRAVFLGEKEKYTQLIISSCPRKLDTVFAMAGDYEHLKNLIVLYVKKHHEFESIILDVIDKIIADGFEQHKIEEHGNMDNIK